MNIQRLPEHIVRWAVIVAGIIVGLISVKMAASGQYGKLLLIYALFAYIGFALFVGPRIWVVLPSVWALNGTIPALDLPFTVRDLMVMLVFGTCLVFKAFKMFNKAAKHDWVDVLLILLVLYVASCWIRNPVGVDAIGSDKVGGRPYFNVFIGCMVYRVLSRSTLRAQTANKMAVSFAFGRMFESFAAQLLAWFPGLMVVSQSYYVCPYFMWVQTPENMPTVPGAESTQRLGYLAGMGQALSFFLAAICWPMQLLNPLKIWRFVLLLIAIGSVLLSGFRSVLLGVIIMFIFSAYYWRGKRELLRMAVIGGFAMAILLVSHGTFFELPLSAQRALSFLPGRWDPWAKNEGADSTRWRVEMWKQMLTTDRYIENHVLGDGFGFRKKDLELMAYYKKYGDTSAGQDSFMISGNVHSGPVSAIRYVGYVGLALFLTTIIGLAVRAWSLLWRARPTPFAVLGFLVCGPMVIEPFMFTVVFGAFDVGILEALFGCGMLKMLENSLEAYEAELRVKSKLPIDSALPIAETPNSVTPTGLQFRNRD